MPQYNFTCNKCNEFWEKHYSFQEYDSIVLPNKEKCPKCKKSKKVKPIFHPPNINLNNTIGSKAEKNTKDLGTYGRDKKYKENSDAIASNSKNKKKSKNPWYGTLPKAQQKNILTEKNEKLKQEKIEKYIKTGQ